MQFYNRSRRLKHQAAEKGKIFAFLPGLGYHEENGIGGNGNAVYEFDL